MKFSKRFPFCYLAEIRSTGSADSSQGVTSEGTRHTSHNQSQDVGSDEDSNVSHGKGNGNQQEAQVEMKTVHSEGEEMDLP